MESLQHSGSVEYAVMRILQQRLVPSFGFDNVVDFVNRDVDPKMYGSVDAFKRDYAFWSFLRKWKGLKHKAFSQEKTAFSTWKKSEEMCFSTNRRLYLESTTGSYSVAPAWIIHAQRKIAQVLGRLDVDRISELCRFGNGATYDLRLGSTHAEKSRKPSVTFDAIPWVCRVLAHDRYLGSLVGPLSGLRVVRANRMVMVPKTVKTHRPIAAEPTLNSYVQQGFGRYIRQRLKRFGVDLGDQTINQDLAERALKDGLSTIDLSSASDTLCINLVKLLLPREWFEALNELRSPNTDYLGKTYHLSKFSSMGNAYTFELESLIFFALVDAVRTSDVFSVYGDDIVVVNADYRNVVSLLTWAGFQVNDDKSFSAGSRFYESCGVHFFDSVEVTPCYQKDVCRRPHDFVRLHNRLIRAGIRLDLRSEFGAAASYVRQASRQRFGRATPGVGPVVEYDEYFIREDFAWADQIVDRVRINSAISLSRVKPSPGRVENVAYFGRKLRIPGYLNPDPKGQCSDSLGTKLLVAEKYHWRSSTISVKSWLELERLPDLSP